LIFLRRSKTNQVNRDFLPKFISSVISFLILSICFGCFSDTAFKRDHCALFFSAINRGLHGERGDFFLELQQPNSSQASPP
jgi:hypothetical protein